MHVFPRMPSPEILIDWKIDWIFNNSEKHSSHASVDLIAGFLYFYQSTAVFIISPPFFMRIASLTLLLYSILWSSETIMIFTSVRL